VQVSRPLCVSIPTQTAHGEKDAKDSALSALQHQLQTAQKKLKDYERAVPELESDLSAAKEQLDSCKQTLEEKTVALIHSRKHLKNARERNMVRGE
jgi:peptidoglycan hydrolase CwlO-like protein